MRSTLHRDRHCFGEDPWNCPGCREEMRAELGVPKPIDYPELQAEVGRLRAALESICGMNSPDDMIDAASAALRTTSASPGEKK